jgi:hypothetical protein
MVGSLSLYGKHSWYSVERERENTKIEGMGWLDSLLSYCLIPSLAALNKRTVSQAASRTLPELVCLVYFTDNSEKATAGHPSFWSFAWAVWSGLYLLLSQNLTDSRWPWNHFHIGQSEYFPWWKDYCDWCWERAPWLNKARIPDDCGWC